MSNSTCSIAGCTGAVLARGWCRAHYRRWQRHGDAGHPTRQETLSALNLPAGCKQCTKCDSVLPESEFYKKRDSLMAHCKACHKVWLAKNYYDSWERRRANAVRWRQENPDLAREHRRKSGSKRRAALLSVEYDPRVTIEALLSRDGDTCSYCHKPVTVDAGLDSKATIDHVMPVARGGPHTFDNTVVACWSCNSSKNARTPEQWAAGAGGYRKIRPTG